MAPRQSTRLDHARKRRAPSNSKFATRKQAAVTTFFSSKPPSAIAAPPDAVAHIPQPLPSPTPPPTPPSPAVSHPCLPPSPPPSSSSSPLVTPSAPQQCPPSPRRPTRNLQICTLSIGCAIPPAPSLRTVITPFRPLVLPAPRSPATESPVTPACPRQSPTQLIAHTPCSELRATLLDDEIADEPDVDIDDVPISRLSRSRNMARRVAERGGAPLAGRGEGGEGEESVLAVVDTGIRGVSETDEDEVVVTRRARKRCGVRAGEMERMDKQKALHPFFKATVAATGHTRERPKRPRVMRHVGDAWEYGGATLHVNCLPALVEWKRAVRWEEGRGRGRRKGRQARRRGGAENVTFAYHFSEAGTGLGRRLARKMGAGSKRKVLEVADVDTELWVNKFKADSSVDVISAEPRNKLVEWLRPWYLDGKAEDGQNLIDDYSDDSCSSFGDKTTVSDREAIAIITGAVGCGKSTIVAGAAQELGLTVLEINASVCRTGRRIKDIIGEALRTHRVSTNQPHDNIDMSCRSLGEQGKGARATRAKTLILFEEVDHLQEDEKGFWSSLQGLAASASCRRPIVCTANSFNSAMRQIFLAPRAPMREDLERLFIHSKEELPMNPTTFKHIAFPERTERQTAAVLKHVAFSEGILLTDDVVQFLSHSYRNDARKAVNLLQFWGLRGLSKPALADSTDAVSYGAGFRRMPRTLASVSRYNLAITADALGYQEAPLLFRAGSSAFAKSTAPSSPLHESGITTECHFTEDEKAMSLWSESLELMSYADMMIHGVEEEGLKRRSAAVEDFDKLCFDVDLESMRGCVEEFHDRALSFSSDCLTFNKESNTLACIAEDLDASSISFDRKLPTNWPVPQRLVLTECFPVLRTMARLENSFIRNPGSSADGVGRRTRANRRTGGFCTLDLHPATIMQLKRACLKPR